MADTLKVAQYKVSQSQAAIESQQSINQELEQRISHLRANKAAEETRQQEEKELLEGKLASLADMFHHGKDFYTDQLLQDEVSSVKNEMQSLTSKVRQTDTEAERLIGLFEALEMVAKKNEDEKGFLGISLETQHQALDLFEQEKKAEEQELVKMKEVERQLLTQLEE
ncbi:kinesin-II 95 kDa subunit-like isoform X2 [Acanthaster planci]|nr:kinesin-II 95 kDa subunit-like isoform X2 [Acanthaster planci]XP_022108266.1 kinesin-II 95 kDa subunit-like isoform X2 [Acanthaster planci]